MSPTDRIVRIRAPLDQRRAVSHRALLDTLEISAATLERDIAFLHDAMNTGQHDSIAAMLRVMRQPGSKGISAADGVRIARGMMFLPKRRRAIGLVEGQLRAAGVTP